MKISLDINILPLKAFFVGFSLKRHHDQLKVAETIDGAIKKCCEKNDSLRKAFYLLIKSEMTRGTDVSIKNREIAKLHCEETNNAYLFDVYMRIVDATNSGYGKVDLSGKGAIDHGYFQTKVDINQDALLSVCALIDSDYWKYIDNKTYPVSDHNEENTYLTKKIIIFYSTLLLKKF